MPIYKILLFTPFIIIALLNAWALIGQITKKQNSSFVPLVGFICFFCATMGLDNYDWWIWLFVLLDIGTLILIGFLPFLLKELFINSVFCRYRVYQNERQIITLYKFKNSQTFNWHHTEKINVDSTPICTGCGGDWQIKGNKLYLMVGENIPMAVAIMNDDKLIFDEVQAGYELLKNEYLIMG